MGFTSVSKWEDLQNIDKGSFCHHNGGEYAYGVASPLISNAPLCLMLSLNIKDDSPAWIGAGSPWIDCRGASLEMASGLMELIWPWLFIHHSYYSHQSTPLPSHSGDKMPDLEGVTSNDVVIA